MKHARSPSAIIRRNRSVGYYVARLRSPLVNFTRQVTPANENSQAPPPREPRELSMFRCFPDRDCHVGQASRSIPGGAAGKAGTEAEAAERRTRGLPDTSLHSKPLIHGDPKSSFCEVDVHKNLRDTVCRHVFRACGDTRKSDVEPLPVPVQPPLLIAFGSCFCPRQGHSRHGAFPGHPGPAGRQSATKKEQLSHRNSYWRREVRRDGLCTHMRLVFTPKTIRHVKHKNGGHRSAISNTNSTNILKKSICKSPRQDTHQAHNGKSTCEITTRSVSRTQWAASV